MTSINNTQNPLNNYMINNYVIPANDSLHLQRPGVVFSQEPVKEDIQNRAMFSYRIPKINSQPCLNVDMRPQETRHDLLGVNMCDRLRNTYANTDNGLNMDHHRLVGHCQIDPFIPSWNKYSASINTESDVKNVFRKVSCDENSVYMPSTNSVMYSKAAMQQTDSTRETGYYVTKKIEEQTGRVPDFFIEDTRQVRMGNYR